MSPEITRGVFDYDRDNVAILPVAEEFSARLDRLDRHVARLTFLDASGDALEQVPGGVRMVNAETGEASPPHGGAFLVAQHAPYALEVDGVARLLLTPVWRQTIEFVRPTPPPPSSEDFEINFDRD